MEQSFNITTAISYVNGPPHIGHVLEFVIADVVSRYYRISGKKVHFLTGTDEHGQKIQDTAIKEKLTPIELCNRNSRLFIDIDKKMMVKYDKFIRTTETYHKNKVYEFYERCKKNNDIYLGEYEGWYNPREEKFVSPHEAKLNNYKDPGNGIDLIHTKEESYFFRLSKYKNSLLSYFDQNPSFVCPTNKRDELVNRLNLTDLDDLSISRTSIDWGIPVPDNSKHVFYVWFDALINYMSDSPWPVDVHVIGKDILWFHTVIWLSMLISGNYSLPKQIYVHDFINDKDGKKMSKSFGNVVDPSSLIEKYPVSAIRYYLISNLNYGVDMNFNEEELIRSHDNELLEIYGNFVNRVFGLVNKYCNSMIMYHYVNGDDIFDLNQTLTHLNLLITEYKLQEYVRRVIDLVRSMNTYINTTHIWTIGKNDNDERSLMNREQIITKLLEGLYIVTHFMYPIIPDISEKVFEFLGTDKININELSWSNLNPGILNKQKTILFEIIDKEAYENRKKKNTK